MTATAAWFEVDKRGLAKLMEGRDKAFVLYELLQNAWDQNVTRVQVWIRRTEQRATVEIIVEDDDPEGFQDLAHAYTLFAESGKRGNPEQRGRFNLGEKMVLALAREARIVTTKGTISFDESGRHESPARRKAGSIITVLIPMTKPEYEQLLIAASRVICPPRIHTTINGDVMKSRRSVVEFEETLPTLIANSDGVLTPTKRKTKVLVYNPDDGEVGWLYEMGIPVVETGDRFDVDVQQKVPLNTDRDNVTPNYLRTVRVAVLNATAGMLGETEVTATWVKEACGDSRVDDSAVRQVFTQRFGDDAVAYDPSDTEANKLSTAGGRQVVHGGTLSADEWINVRRAGVLPPAGQVTPSPKPFSPGGKPLKLVSENDWTMGIQQIVTHARMMARELLGSGITIQVANDIGWPFAAVYGPESGLIFNLGRLGHKFFDGGITDDVNDLLIHEFGHHYSKDHLSEEYYDALSSLGARMVRLALDKPELFR